MKTNIVCLPYPSELNNPIQNFITSSLGLTKRELFAAMVMRKICTASEFGSPESMAIHALKCADALINELNKEK